ncbi:MAG: hypothetical protein M3Y08_11765 [Fibrobacterota bacterium]|nr:hypothetical protein [Fibrobacterota bacterium]
MGITIHYRGRVHPKTPVKQFYILTQLICNEKKWTTTGMAETDGPAILVHLDEEIPYNGKLTTFSVKTHENCEPLLFQITHEGYFRNWCKTQFAPIEIHKGIVDLFEQVKIKLVELVIEDDGGFWETRDSEVLEERILNCYLAIQKAKEEDPEYYGPIKGEDGRIVDLLK